MKTGAGFYVFRVTKITKASKQSLQQSASGIRQLLMTMDGSSYAYSFNATVSDLYLAESPSRK